MADKGYLMEMRNYDEKGKLASTMKVVNISKKPITIRLSDYTVTKMNGQ